MRRLAQPSNGLRDANRHSPIDHLKYLFISACVAVIGVPVVSYLFALSALYPMPRQRGGCRKVPI